MKGNYDIQLQLVAIMETQLSITFYLWPELRTVKITLIVMDNWVSIIATSLNWIT